MKNPCFNEETRTDCPKRRAGCAVDCPEWAAYEKERNAEYERRRIQFEVDSISYDGIRKAKERYIKREMNRQRSHRKGGSD